MSDWLFWLGFVYITGTVLWFVVSVLAWVFNKGIDEDKAQRAAWWVTRTPMWPWYALVGTHQAARALVFDAMKGKP